MAGARQPDEQSPLADGGEPVEASSGDQPDAATVHENTDYLEREVNILRPSTQFMRDHLRLIWIGFAAWAVVIFGPVTATYLAPGPMTETTFLGFPLHYFLVAIGGPGGALVLSIIYSWRRDKLDEKYDIQHGRSVGPDETAAGDSDARVTTDGGIPESADGVATGAMGHNGVNSSDEVHRK